MQYIQIKETDGIHHKEVKKKNKIAPFTHEKIIYKPVHSQINCKKGNSENNKNNSKYLK